MPGFRKRLFHPPFPEEMQVQKLTRIAQLRLSIPIEFFSCSNAQRLIGLGGVNLGLIEIEAQLSLCSYVAECTF